MQGFRNHVIESPSEFARSAIWFSPSPNLNFFLLFEGLSLGQLTYTLDRSVARAYSSQYWVAPMNSPQGGLGGGWAGGQEETGQTSERSMAPKNILSSVTLAGKHARPGRTKITTAAFFRVLLPAATKRDLRRPGLPFPSKEKALRHVTCEGKGWVVRLS